MTNLQPKQVEYLLTRIDPLLAKATDLAGYAYYFFPDSANFDSLPEHQQQMVLNHRSRVLERYPEEVALLHSPEGGDSFISQNNGLLIAFELVKALLEPQSSEAKWEEQVKEANEHFDDLTTGSPFVQHED